MTIKAALPTVVAGICLFMAGCAPMMVDTMGSQGARAPEAAASGAPPASVTVADVQTKRQLERELDRDCNDFLKRLSERNIDAALEFVAPEKKADKQTELWRFMAEYSFDNFEILYRNMDLGGKTPTAEIKAVLVVYQKNVVAPSKRELVVKWKRVGERWLVAQ